MLSQILIYCVVTYLLMAFVKAALMMGNLSMAATSLHRASWSDGKHSLFACYSAMVFQIVVSSLLRWPSSLCTERFAFFTVYSNRQVVRAIRMSARHR